MILPNAFFLIIPLAGIICIILVAILIAKPLALNAYLSAVQAAQEPYRKLYLPFYVLPEPEQDTHQLILGEPGAGKTTMLRMFQYAAVSAQNRRSILRGHSKIPVYIPLKHYNLFLKTYRQVSSTHDVADDADTAGEFPIAPTGQGEAHIQPRTPNSTAELTKNITLIDFLCESDLPGMHHLQRYLKKLVVQGRIVFLCDGLNEIDHHYLDAVSAELAYVLRWTRNRLLITCRDVDYRTQLALKRLVDDGQLMCTELQPLQPEQIRGCVEHYISEQGDRRTYIPEQILEVIDRSRLRYQCTNPMMLFTFLEIIDGIGVQRDKQIDTRGRLLREYISQLIESERRQSRWNGEAPAESAVLTFLGKIACAARWTNDRNAIKLPVTTVNGKAARTLHSEGLTEALQLWLDEHPPQGPFATDAEGAGQGGDKDAGQGAGQSGAQGAGEGGNQGAGKLTPLLTTERGGTSLPAPSKLVQFAQSAGLIDVSADGVLSFCHELIAAYLVASYFSAVDSEMQPPSPFREELLVDAARWSDVVAIWAGLLDDPLLLAERLATWGVGPRVEDPAYVIEALSLSLVCIGVLWTPPQADQQHPIVLPLSIEEILVEALQDAEEREKLAHIFTRCAGEGGQEIYHALVPSLALEGIDKLLVLLDETVVPDMLFNQLVAVVDDAAYEAQVKCLIPVLGKLGSAVVERAAEWCQPEPGRSIRLRAAMVNILGRANEQGAVEPLLARLNDPEPFIRGRAINALILLGPTFTLPRLIQELEHYVEVDGPRQLVHLAVLMVLDRFLDEQDIQQVTPVQRQQILEAIVPVLTSDYAAETQQQALEILVRQAHIPAGRISAQVLDLLVHNLSSENEEIRHSVAQALQVIGPIATPMLLAQLKRESLDIVRKHIIEVFEGMDVLDQRALPHLMHLLADPSPIVQQQAANALRTYAPNSIPGLIELVLFHTDDAVATRAAQVLGDIGDAISVPVMQALPQLVPGRTRLLVQALERVHDTQAIPALVTLLQTPGIESLLALSTIHALSQYPDTRVVPPLLAVLASSDVQVYEEAINALSYLGEVALPSLIAALGTEGVGALSEARGSRAREASFNNPFAPAGWEGADSLTKMPNSPTASETLVQARVRRALLGMVPFPSEQLINVLAVASETQAEQIVMIFLAKGSDAARGLVTHLADSDNRVQGYVRYTLTGMESHIVVPALLEVLHHPALRSAVEELLHMHPQEAVPQLVSLLGDPERGDAAATILLDIGLTIQRSEAERVSILQMLIPGLDDANVAAQERAQRIIVDLVRQAPEILPQVVHLFSLFLPQRAREGLQEVLTNELADVSIPALLDGLENAYLIEDVSEAFVRLVQKHDAQSESALQGLFDALRMEERQHGGKIVLVNVGAEAVPGLINLIADPDQSLAQAAQEILRDIGVAAFPAIWAASSDVSNRVRREAALSTFRSMPTIEIKDGLIEHLLSDKLESISMALGLLLERIASEAMLPRVDQEMIRALLEHVQTHAVGAGVEKGGDGELASALATRRIIALLLLVGGSDVANHIAWGLYHYYNQPGHQEQLTQTFLLLGIEAEEVLLEMMRYRATPPELLAEVVGMLGMMMPHQDVYEYAKAIGYPGLPMFQTSMTYPERLTVALRALGGLLAGGHLNSSTLQDRQASSIYGSPEHELYSVLLGKPYGPLITKLENDLRTAEYEYEKARRQLAIQLTLMQHEKQELAEEIHQLEVRNQQLETTIRRLQDMLRQVPQA